MAELPTLNAGREGLRPACSLSLVLRDRGFRHRVRSTVRLVICALAVCALLATTARAQGSPPDRRFGAVEAFRDPVAAAEAGVGWDRILFYWSELQPGGPDDWNSYHVPDDWLNLAADAGREVVGLLKHTPEWATDGPVGCGVPRGLDLPVDDPGNLWATFVRRVVEMYAGRIDHWIIWNEPDIAPETYGAEWCGSVEDYYRLLKVAYLAAHEVNPQVTIHLAGLTYWHDVTSGRPYYLRRLLDVATQDPTGPEHGYYFDVVSLHIYFRTETIPDVVEATRSTLAAYGLQKPIWIDETNAPPNSDPEWYMPEANYEISLEEQASFLIQAFALALSEKVERVAVYQWMDHDLLPYFEPFGLLRSDSSRRPAFDAFRLITEHYAGTFAAQEDRQPGYTVVTLEQEGRTTRVLWARTEADAEVSIPALAAQARLIDQTGAERVIEPTDGQYTLTLPRARCADTRGCIIGGPTYLLIEEVSDRSPSPQGTPTPEGTVTATGTVTTSLIEPVAATTPSPTPTPSPTVTPSPTATEAPTPAPPSPSLTPQPTAASPRPTSAWSIAAGTAGVVLLAAAVSILYSQTSRRRKGGN